MLKIFNTLSGKIENFEATEDNKVKMYLCGPTVYDNAHLGHGRSAASFDLIRRYLIYKGYNVIFVSNYTDIDDKMIDRANREGITVKELAEKIIPEYVKDYGDLNILPADKNPKATEHIETQIKMVKDLMAKDIAYELEDGIYFDISKFKEYGKLSKQKLDELNSGARIEVDASKRNPQDFVLWKKSKPGEPKWDSPFGEGRPGWHIECSAMNLDIFGETIDIHGGGLDLTFPHHECEIAQTESYTGKQFVKYWMHNGFVKVNNEKMSKSLNNFFTLKDIFKEYDPLVVRFLLISNHYRNPIDFSDEILNQSKNGLRRLHEFISRLNSYEKSSSITPSPSVIPDPDRESSATKALVEKTQENFEKFMDNDFDSSGAFGAIFDFVKEINRMMDEKSLSGNDIDEIKAFIAKIDSVLGILEIKNEEIPEEIKKLIEERENYRKEKNWQKSDEMRNLIKEKGYEIEDTKDGTKCRKI